MRQTGEILLVTVSYRAKMILSFQSGGICALPRCGKSLVYDSPNSSDQHVAEAAHIKGEKPGAARYDPNMTQEERDAVENLLFLCPTCHTVIDKSAIDWPTEKLLEIKTAHRQRILEAYEAAFADVAFEELERSVDWVSTQDIEDTGSSFALITPKEKLKRNGLSNSSKQIIIGALAAQRIVAAFVESEAQLDPTFPEKLRYGFMAHYFKLLKEGHKGDMLFDLMCVFAQRGMQLQKDRSAGLAVLVYLFEKCDVFEK